MDKDLIVDRTCWKCGKKVHRWEFRGENIEASPGIIVFSHENCKFKGKLKRKK